MLSVGGDTATSRTERSRTARWLMIGAGVEQAARGWFDAWPDAVGCGGQLSAGRFHPRLHGCFWHRQTQSKRSVPLFHYSDCRLDSSPRLTREFNESVRLTRRHVATMCLAPTLWAGCAVGCGGPCGSWASFRREKSQRKRHSPHASLVHALPVFSYSARRATATAQIAPVASI